MCIYRVTKRQLGFFLNMHTTALRLTRLNAEPRRMLIMRWERRSGAEIARDKVRLSAFNSLDFSPLWGRRYVRQVSAYTGTAYSARVMRRRAVSMKIHSHTFLFEEIVMVRERILISFFQQTGILYPSPACKNIFINCVPSCSLSCSSNQVFFFYFVLL